MLDEVIDNAVEQLTAVVLDALARDEAPTPAALRFLLRMYVAGGRDDIRLTIEPSLAVALEIAPSSPLEEQPDWLVLFAEAAEASGDDRLRAAGLALASNVRLTWGREGALGAVSAGVDACLRAAELVAGGDPRSLIQPAIDELERVVGAAYEPGRGVSDRLADQVAAASALVTAYRVTGRLPYSMLAEELMQVAGRVQREQFDGATFALNCAAAVVLGRLAVLHGTDEYRTAAVIAPGADYGADAARILRSLAPVASRQGLAGAAYGLAATERRSAR